MKEYKKTLVVTRDKTDSGYLCFWYPKDKILVANNGEWVTDSLTDPEIALGPIAFKKQFGYLPRKGSRETIEIIVRRLK